ncbi:MULTISPECIES: maltokinase N-terminal cap-like domain-containing protein [unclassified Luteococcus]|uniref:maltokinase N-terminal cap-like domain-containing protein n=1 Tax=unclassified Luteococcus TaxID=2639923 RepID=UPI00313E1711
MSNQEHDHQTEALAALQDFVLQARWFSGKGRDGQLAGLEQPDWIVQPGGEAPAVRSEFVTVAYPDDSHEYYQLLVSYRPEPLDDCLIGPALEPELGFAHDAPRDPAAMTAVLNAILAGSQSPHAWSESLPDGGKLRGDLTPRVFGGEQSNTNVLLGDVALMKIFRKLEIGPNLDIQMHDALGRARVSSAARLYGWVSGALTPFSDEAWTDGADAPETQRVDLMMVSELLRDAQDGWELACELALAGTDFTDRAAALGAALAEVHTALADTFETAMLDGAQVATTMRKRLEAATAQAPDLTGQGAALVAVFDRLAGRKLVAQRVHGDFHLGQTLLTPDGWKIIDFEGEPMKSFAERQLPDSPLRDVAGMLRSFGYVTSVFDEPTGDAAQQWLAGARRAFLDAYARQAGPIDEAALAAYEADKAVYEVVYETRNRPDWVEIPLSALEAIATSNEQED